MQYLNISLRSLGSLVWAKSAATLLNIFKIYIITKFCSIRAKWTLTLMFMYIYIEQKVSVYGSTNEVCLLTNMGIRGIRLSWTDIDQHQVVQNPIDFDGYLWQLKTMYILTVLLCILESRIVKWTLTGGISMQFPHGATDDKYLILVIGRGTSSSSLFNITIHDTWHLPL